MEINPNRPLQRLQSAKPKPKAAKTAQAAPILPLAPDIGETTALSSLEGVLKSMPEERPEKIEEGLSLARDPQYPSRDELTHLGLRVIRDELGDKLSGG